MYKTGRYRKVAVVEVIYIVKTAFGERRKVVFRESVERCMFHYIYTSTERGAVFVYKCIFIVQDKQGYPHKYFSYFFK